MFDGRNINTSNIEPGFIICTYFKLKYVIEEINYLIPCLICSAKAAESHIDLRNVTIQTNYLKVTDFCLFTPEESVASQS